jgi:TonB family protein
VSDASRIILLLSLILIPAENARTAASDKSADAAALLANAEKLENLKSEPAAPFLLRATLAASLSKGKVSGEYAMSWTNPNQWREVLALADFRRVREGAADGYNQVRSLDYQPEIIFDVVAAIDIDSLLRLSPVESLKKVAKRKINGIELNCMSVSVHGYTVRQLCFDPSSGLLTHSELSSFGTPERARESVEYSDFLSLGPHQFPSKLKLSSHAGYSLEISVPQLESLAIPPTPTLAGDPRSEFWRDCRGAAAPALLQQPRPIYPEDSKLKGEQGEVVVYARIEPDGSLSHLKPLQSPSPALQQATLDSLRFSKYKPRVCDGVAVRDEALIRVDYALSR